MKRAVATVAYAILTPISVAISLLAVWYHSNPGHLPAHVSARVTPAVAVVAAGLALLLLIGLVLNGRRWHLARAVARLSNDPYLAHAMPGQSLPQVLPRARLIPLLDVNRVRPRKLPRPRALRRVTAAANVTGHRPLSIAYLRLFENETRTRTFMQSAWREFGHVHFLRSAESVTPAEFRHARSGIFLTSREQFLAELARTPPAPSTKHWQSFRNIAPRTIRVWDRYGSYLPAGHLCHGTIWKLAIDELFRCVDLVVLDLSGFTPSNHGTEYELQRVIDRFPIERIVFLADARSNRNFLERQIQAAWQHMAAGSPNSGTRPRTACLAVTDHYWREQRPPRTTGTPGQGQVVVQQGPGQLRLAASRGQSRRLAAAAQRRVFQAPLVSSPRPGPSTEPETTPVPVVQRRGEPWPATPPPSGPEPASGRRIAGKLVALAASFVFLASVAYFPDYTSMSPDGPVSFYRASRHDLWSPLHYYNFWIAIALLALVFVFTIISFAAAGRSLMTGATLGALVLAGYTLYIPTIKSDGFSAYGSGYWASLAAAAAMALGAGLAAVMTSGGLRHASWPAHR